MKTAYNTLGRDTKGRLTHYSLACGYIELIEAGNSRIELWKEPGCKVYSVRKGIDGKRLFWKSFSTRWEAYNFFNKNK
jgi:hypothetical protein